MLPVRAELRAFPRVGMPPACRVAMTTSYYLAACPVCAGDSTEEIADATALAAERSLLSSLPPRPSVGDGHDVVCFTQPPPLRLARCRGCGLLYRNPVEARVDELYAEEPTPTAALAALCPLQRQAFEPVVQRLTALHGKPGRGIEVGSYTGAFLAAAAAAGWQFEAVDVNGNVVDFLKAGGWRVTRGTIHDVPPEASFDVVAFWNCFEQLPDPAAAARAAADRLRIGGIIAMRVPNGEFYSALRPLLSGPFRRLARALLAHHNFLGFPYRYGFTRASLARLLDAAGFDLARVAGAGVLPAGAGGHPARERLLDAAALALRPLAGEPWLEVYAIRR